MYQVRVYDLSLRKTIHYRISSTNFNRPTGDIHWHDKFLPHFCTTRSGTYETVLQSLTGSPRPKTLDWTQELNKAFEKAKNTLSQATLLHHPVPGAPLALTTDASDIAIGAVLEQPIHGQW